MGTGQPEKTADFQECYNKGIEIISEALDEIKNNPDEYGGEIDSFTLLATKKKSQDDGIYIKDTEIPLYTLYLAFSTVGSISSGLDSLAVIVLDGCRVEPMIEIYKTVKEKYDYVGLHFLNTHDISLISED